MTAIEPAPAAHPWTRYVALGDSFTEGVGDPEPDLPNGLRGWADRVAEQLAMRAPAFSYANLAIRGRLLDQIAAEQVEPALALHPDLITISGGGNDIIRPGSDPDAIAARFERVIERLAACDATIVIITGIDVHFQPVFARMRGRVAIYNEHLRAIAEHHGCLVADQWGLRTIQRRDMWTDDRLHLNAFGHHEVARMVLDALDVEHELEPMRPEPLAARPWRTARAEDAVWVRNHLAPWVMRRLRGTSSGDAVTPKRPTFDEPLFPIEHPADVSADDLESGLGGDGATAAGDGPAQPAV